jgi:hypothetical protein
LDDDKLDGVTLDDDKLDGVTMDDDKLDGYKELFEDNVLLVLLDGIPQRAW